MTFQEWLRFTMIQIKPTMNISSPRRAHHEMRSLLLSGASALVLISASPSLALDAGALPSGGAVVGGSASLDYSTPNALHIHQSTDRVVINWDSFNIGKDGLTQFHQNNSSSLAVNRVTGAGARSNANSRTA